MSLILSNQKTAISVRKDPNVTTKPGIRIQPSVIVSLPPQINYRPPFNPDGTLSTPSILQFARKIATDWFPSDNFTTRPMPAGNLVVNGNALGKMDITVIPGQTIAPSEAFTNVAINDDLFSQTKDIASAWIVVKGNLTLNNTAILRPKVRKLFTVIYVTGDLTISDNTSYISMTARGANHSGIGDSAGATTAVDIQVGPNTMISATGGAGAAENTTAQTATDGANGSSTQGSLGSGGGGGGWNDYPAGGGEIGGGGETPPVFIG